MDELTGAYHDERLCQEMVEPPLLIHGRKFSMRVYVYYFLNENTGSPASVYVSRLGLVKVASVSHSEYNSGFNSDYERIHMTNSGREETMLQFDFEFLRKQFDEKSLSFDKFWSNLRQSIGTLMENYESLVSQQLSETPSTAHLRSRLASLGLPKILGLDYLVRVTSSKQASPILIEVNRFPGLEARGEDDEAVKTSVVQDAWICAARRLGIAIRDVGILPSADVATTDKDAFEQIWIS
jgi:hypothetical protein